MRSTVRRNWTVPSPNRASASAGGAVNTSVRAFSPSARLPSMRNRSVKDAGVSAQAEDAPEITTTRRNASQVRMGVDLGGAEDEERASFDLTTELLRVFHPARRPRRSQAGGQSFFTSLDNP